MDYTEVVARLTEERQVLVARLSIVDTAIQVLDQLQNGAAPTAKMAEKAAPKRISKLSAQGRRNIIAAQKKRWAKRRIL